MNVTRPPRSIADWHLCPCGRHFRRPFPGPRSDCHRRARGSLVRRRGTDRCAGTRHYDRRAGKPCPRLPGRRQSTARHLWHPYLRQADRQLRISAAARRLGKSIVTSTPPFSTKPCRANCGSLVQRTSVRLVRVFPHDPPADATDNPDDADDQDKQAQRPFQSGDESASKTRTSPIAMRPSARITSIRFTARSPDGLQSRMSEFPCSMDRWWTIVRGFPVFAPARSKGCSVSNRPNLLRAGIVAPDLGKVSDAPYATLLKAQAGAEVIKIAPPDDERLRRRALPG